MAYGPDTVHKHLLTSLPSSDAKAFIITGNSLVTKTPLVNQVKKILGDRHAGTFSRIGQHAPQATVQEAEALIAKDADITTLISIGGGSPVRPLACFHLWCTD